MSRESQAARAYMAEYDVNYVAALKVIRARWATERASRTDGEAEAPESADREGESTATVDHSAARLPLAPVFQAPGE